MRKSVYSFQFLSRQAEATSSLTVRDARDADVSKRLNMLFEPIFRNQGVCQCRKIGKGWKAARSKRSIRAFSGSLTAEELKSLRRILELGAGEE